MMHLTPVFRHIKHPDRLVAILEAAQKVQKHWQDLALDQGLDPAKNVVLQESEKEIRVMISEQLSAVYAEEPGTWR
jgi:hypothetical protein